MDGGKLCRRESWRICCKTHIDGIKFGKFSHPHTRNYPAKLQHTVYLLFRSQYTFVHKTGYENNFTEKLLDTNYFSINVFYFIILV